MGRNFANKIWNASRLVLQGAHPQAEAGVELTTPADRWIFSRLATVERELAGTYEAYEFDDAARLLYRFIWNELCDWYLEVAKTRLYSEDEAERLTVSGNLAGAAGTRDGDASPADAVPERGDLPQPAAGPEWATPRYPVGRPLS